MKIRFISFFLFMLAMSCFMACSSDDPGEMLSKCPTTKWSDRIDIAI